MMVLTRRALLGAAALSPLLARPAFAEEPLAALERQFDTRLGVAALDMGTGRVFSHRGDERFAFCSTFKTLLVGAVLKRVMADRPLLGRHIDFTAADLVTYSPDTEPQAGKGMSVAELCAATLRSSDNSAANLLLREIGGPAAVTDFARLLGDDTFRLDRIEPELNEAAPGDLRDTTTPQAMARTLGRLVLGDVLGNAERSRLVAWMQASTTGAKRIRAGVPDDWALAGKTGSGQYGIANDIAVLWPPGRAPLVLAVFSRRPGHADIRRDEPVAEAARLAVRALG